MTAPIPHTELSAVNAGEKMACFDLLAAGIESGWLPQATPALGTHLPLLIPHRIAQYWHSRVLPEDVQAAVQSMRTHNPGFEHHLVCDEEARAFIQTRHGTEGARLYDACFHATMRSDFWRLCDLYEHGGLYVDVDTLAHAPLARIAAGAEFSCLLTYSIGAPWCIDNDFMIATRRHPLILAALEGMFANVTRFLHTRAFENVWVETGPGNMTMATMRWLANAWSKRALAPAQTRVLFRHHNAVGDAFNITDMAYKSTPEGNWRGAVPPP